MSLPEKKKKKSCSKPYLWLKTYTTEQIKWFWWRIRTTFLGCCLPSSSISLSSSSTNNMKTGMVIWFSPQGGCLSLTAAVPKMTRCHPTRWQLYRAADSPSASVASPLCARRSLFKMLECGNACQSFLRRLFWRYRIILQTCVASTNWKHLTLRCKPGIGSRY